MKLNNEDSECNSYKLTQGQVAGSSAGQYTKSNQPRKEQIILNQTCTQALKKSPDQFPKYF